MIFEPFGEQGQKKLSQSTALICGCGALGGSIAQILVRSGIGTLRLVDFDVVSLDNLHRQFLFTEDDAAQKRFKVEAATQTLRQGNSTVRIETFTDRFSEHNADRLLENVDILIDATDHFEMRFLLNKTALRKNLPLVTGGINGTCGQVMTIIPGRTPCLSCLLDPQTPPNATPVFPVLSPIVQVISAYQAMEAIKILSGNLESINRSLVKFDLWTNQVKFISLGNLLPCRCR